MKSTRREFLGTMGGITAGFIAGRTTVDTQHTMDHIPPTERTIPADIPQESSARISQSHIVQPEASTQVDAVPMPEQEISPNTLEPRLSPMLEVHLQERMLDLLRDNGFNAGRVFMRAANEWFEGQRLIPLVHQTFRESLSSQREFNTMDTGAMAWMTDICTYGQVTAESEWDTTARPGYGSARGLWQIRDIARNQIDLELGPGRQQINREHPTISTTGAAEFYGYLQRSLRDKIAAVEERFDVTPTEFAIPLLMSAYHTGATPMHRGIEHYLESHPDTTHTGLDVFADYTEFLRDTTIRHLSDHTPDYFFKCLALKRIYDQIPSLLK